MTPQQWFAAAAGPKRGLRGLGHPDKIVGFDPDSGTWYYAAAGLGNPGKIVGMMQQPDGTWWPVEAAAGLGQPARSFWQLPPGSPDWMRPPDWMALGNPGKIVGFDPKTGTWYYAAAGVGQPTAPTSCFVDSKMLGVLAVAGAMGGVAYEALTAALTPTKPRYFQAAGIGMAAAAAGWSMLRGIAT